MRSCLFSVRDCSAGLGLPQTDQRAIRILWLNLLPFRIAYGWPAGGTSGWFHKSPSITRSDGSIFPNPSQPDRSRTELSWWLLDTATPKPFHQRTDMFKRLRYRQCSPWTLTHMGSRCHGSLTGGSPVMRELFTLRWGIQAVYEKETGSDSLHTHSPTPSAWFTHAEPNTRALKWSMGKALEVISDLDNGMMPRKVAADLA